ncbi:MAG TPA: M23 family metallopeptidase [Thermoanaerobaculia bacterium]
MRAAAGSRSLEIQIHPGDIRKRVRYFFLSRRHLIFGSVLALLYLAGIALAAAVAPGVVGGLMSRREYQALISERRLQGERLQALVGRMEDLDRHAQSIGLRMEAVFLVYGLPPARPRVEARPAAAADSRSIYDETIDEGRRLQGRLRERLQELDTALGEVRDFEASHPEEVRTTPSACPLRGSDLVLVGTFGKRRSPFTHEMEIHSGADLAAPVGTPVYATADGVVAFAGQVPLGRSAHWYRYGNVVIVQNGDGFFTVFGHDERVEVRAGQRVKRGDLLATVGNTGWATSPRLYYEIRRRDAGGVYRPVDPLVYILDRHWPNEDRLLVAARTAPPLQVFEPLPVPAGQPSFEKRLKRRKAGAS